MTSGLGNAQGDSRGLLTRMGTNSVLVNGACLPALRDSFTANVGHLVSPPALLLAEPRW
jgi:hypothetical protein